jgi:small subunit ribosomal protein S1
MKRKKKIIVRKDDKLQSLYDEIPSPKSFTRGDIVSGTVLEIRPGELVIDIGGRSEGVVSGRELKLEGEKFEKKPGESVLVYVIKPENEEGQIELSIRRTGTARKWQELTDARDSDKPIKVEVLEANTGGVIVSIGGGLRGFVPSSQLKNNRIYSDSVFDNKEDATKQLQSKLAELIGEELEVKVIEIDKEKNRVILSEKLVYSEADIKQRNSTLTNLKVGDVLEGVITGIAPFGLFVNAQGLEGLVHLSEISWDKVANPADFFKIGDKVQVQVIGLQENGKRVAYSIKRLQQDPWKDIVGRYKMGQIVDGEVKSLADYGAFVKIEDGLNGLIHISELSNKLVRNPSDIVKVGQKIKVMIISISDEDRHLGLSLKRIESKEAPIAKVSKKEEVKSTSNESSREMEGLDKLLAEAETEENA